MLINKHFAQKGSGRTLHKMLWNKLAKNKINVFVKESVVCGWHNSTSFNTQVP